MIVRWPQCDPSPTLPLSRMEALALAKLIEQQQATARPAPELSWVNAAQLWQKLLDHGRGT